MATPPDVPPPSRGAAAWAAGYRCQRAGRSIALPMRGGASLTGGRYRSRASSCASDSASQPTAMESPAFPRIRFGGSNVARNRPALRCGTAEPERRIVKVAVTPSFRRVVTFDDGMSRGVEMLARVPMR